MSTRPDDLRARMAASMAQSDPASMPAQNAPPRQEMPLTLEALRASPLGMLLEAAIAPLGVAGGAVDMKSAWQNKSPLGGILAALAMLPGPMVPGAGKAANKLPDVSGGNFTRSLKDFAPSVFRETSLSKLEDILPTGKTIADPGELFFGTENMARGQGKNKGVLLEFDTEGLTGVVNTAKPGWKAAYEQGDAEFVGRQLKQSSLQNSLRSVTINSEAIADNVTKRRLGPVLAELEKAGWLKLSLEGGAVRYLHPTRVPK